MAMLRYGNAALVNAQISPDNWANLVYADACKGGKCRMKTARTVLAQYDPKKYLLSHCSIIAAVDVDEAPTSASKFKDYLIKPEFSKFVNNNGDAWTKNMIQACYKTFVGANNYLEHVQIPELSKGRVIDAALREIPFGKDRNGKDLSTFYVDILVATNRKHGDLVRKIEAGEMNTLSMGCFLSGTEITVADGTKRRIEDLVPGDDVITHTGKIRPILNVQKKWYSGTIRLLKVDGDYKTTYVTPEHPFWAFQRKQQCACGCGESLNTKLTSHGKNFDGKDFFYSQYKQGHYARVVNPNSKTYSLDKYRRLKESNQILDKLELSWIKSGDLKIGDLVSYPISEDVLKTADATVDKARLIGYFLAEGSFAKEVVVEGEENDYGVKCRICGKIYNMISTHLPVHGMGLDEYKSTYPDAPLKAKLNKSLIKSSRRESFSNIGFFKNRKRVGVEFSLGKHEYETVNKEICDLAKKVFPEATILRYEKSVKVIGKNVSEFFFKYCGEYFDGKKLHEDVLFWPKEIQKHVIATWVLGDFSVTGSKDLFDQMHWIITRSRIIHNLYEREEEPYHTVLKKKTINGEDVSVEYTGTRAKAYSIQINATGFEKLKDELNYSFNYSTARMKDPGFKQRNCWKNVQQSSWFMRPLKEIEEIPYEGWVYNFEVDEDNSYIANDMAVHNCVISYSLCTKCGNKAVDESEACRHVRWEKRNSFHDSNTGTQRIVAELCGHASEPDSVRFVDASWVKMPAFTGAVRRNTIEIPADIQAKIESAHKSENYNKKEGDFLKAASHLIAQEEGTPEEEAVPVDETEETAPEVPDKEIPPEEPAAEEPAPGEEAPAEAPLPPEEDTEFNEEDIKKWKTQVKKKLLEEFGQEIIDQMGKKPEDMTMDELETLDETLIRPASLVLKKVWGAKKSWDRYLQQKMGHLDKKSFNKLRYGTHMALTSNDLTILADYGYNKRDFLAVMSFLDENFKKSLPLQIKKAISKLGGMRGKGPVEILSHIVSDIGRKLTREEASRSLAWLGLLDRYND